MALRKYKSTGNASSVSIAPLDFPNKVLEKINPVNTEMIADLPAEADVHIDRREVYFLIMHFLSAGPCKRTYGQLWNELLEHQLLPRRYHAWYSRSGLKSGDEEDDGMSLPLGYVSLAERYSHIEKDHLVKLLKQLISSYSSQSHTTIGGGFPSAADVPTILGSGPFSLLSSDRDGAFQQSAKLPGYLRWPHMQADQVRGLSLREIGGGFTKHHRAPSVRAACYAIAKPSTLVQKMQIIKKLRGHQNAVYCATFDRSGRYVITGSDDRLVKIWSMETAFCLASCRGHEGDITDLAVNSSNYMVASSSNDFTIRVWRIPDGMPVSVLRGHTAAVTAIAFSPRPSAVYQLLSSSDDGTCRIWDARHSQPSLRVYIPRPPDVVAGKGNDPPPPPPSAIQQSHQILCCAFNANGIVFVTGSSDTYARVWNACKSSTDESEQPNHEMDLLSGHENDVNYVQFSGCAVASRSFSADAFKEDNVPRFKNSWFTHDNIVTCSRDGSAIIWVPRSRRSHAKVGRWTRAYHLKVPPPPMLPQSTRGGPRQRYQPTPRGVNMIVWSLDNRFVLAAIMDCRICVWNASDGSLVHSLIGHTQSTFVLDVHPFNPRIAMSAGYDGKTIIWDIWEGKPVQIYETGQFKLVDGKFSPDGTSIILSDEVGQIYIIATGQGESQKDAKYDQFFLGDYRPLIHDSNGNVLDQETQLLTYRRNIQDLLCDSSMIPYPEPYQLMYQRHRLDTLGIEWRPPSVNFAVGPTYNAETGEYQMLPIIDLDRWAEPLPVVVDAIDWEQENDAQTDDADSEYNVTDEYSSGEEHEVLHGSSAGDSECSAEVGLANISNLSSLRRSKRKKHKKEAEFVTSSGRRVKRRNLDEHEGATPSRTHRVRKSRRKSPKSRALRPQRRAARNALSLFSKITGASTDGEDEYESESSSSENEVSLPESHTQSFESEMKDSRGREILRDECEEVAKPSGLSETLGNAAFRTKLILKLPRRDPKATISSGSTKAESIAQVESVTGYDTVNRESSHHQSVWFSGEADDALKDKMLDAMSEQPNVSSVQHSNAIKWGEVKLRSSKRPKVSDSAADTWPACPDGPHVVGGDANSHVKTNDEHTTFLNHQNDDGESDLVGNAQLIVSFAQGSHNSRVNMINPGFNGDEQCSLQHIDKHYGIVLPINGEKPEPAMHVNEEFQDSHGKCRRKDGSDHKQKAEAGSRPFYPKLRIKSTGLAKESGLKYAALGDRMSSEYDSMAKNPMTEQNVVSAMAEEDEGTSRLSPNRILVYSRSKSSRSRRNSDGDINSTEEGTSISNNNGGDQDVDFSVVDNGRGTRFRNKRATDHLTASESNYRITRNYGSLEASTSGRRSFLDGNDRLLCDEWNPISNPTVGLRSVRNRRESFSFSEPRLLDKRKHQSAQKISWLMLTEHEECYRYIPQQGDEVAYLRQGHEEYLKSSKCSHEAGPWKSIKVLKAVEFCSVRGLDYSTFTGSGDSCCKLTLEFNDPSSSGFGKAFKITLPELLDYPDFLVERTRYDAAIERNWTHRDKCQVWWRNADGLGGSWWEGRILLVKPKSPEFPQSPWERFVIQYKNDSSVPHSHSPWELHDSESQWQHPHIDVRSRDKLLSCIAKLERASTKSQDHYGVQKLKQVAHKTDFVNRFPVQFSLEVIKRRLENNYYRTVEAVQHDASVMLSHAESYFSKSAEITMKIRRLSDWITTHMFSSS